MTQRMHNVVARLGLSGLLSSFKQRIHLDTSTRSRFISYKSDRKIESVYSTATGFNVTAFKKRTAPYVEDSASPYRRLYPCKNRSEPTATTTKTTPSGTRRPPILTVSGIQNKLANERYSFGKDSYLKGIRWPPLYKYKGVVQETARGDRNTGDSSHIMMKPLYSSKNPYDPGAFVFSKNSIRPSISRKGFQSRNYRLSTTDDPFRINNFSQSKVNKLAGRENTLKKQILHIQTNIQSEIEQLKFKIIKMHAKKADLLRDQGNSEEVNLSALQEIVESAKTIQSEVSTLKVSPSEVCTKNEKENRSRDLKATKETAREDFTAFKEALLQKIEESRASGVDVRCKRRQITKFGRCENHEPSKNEASTNPSKEVIKFPRGKRSLLGTTAKKSHSRRKFSSLIQEPTQTERNSSLKKKQEGFLETVKTLFFPTHVEAPVRKLKQKGCIKDDTASPPKDSVSLKGSQQVVRNKMESDDKTSVETVNQVSLNSVGEKVLLPSNEVVLEKINEYRKSNATKLARSCGLCEKKLTINEIIPPVETLSHITISPVNNDVLRSSPPVTSAVIRSIQNFKVPLRAQIADFRKQRRAPQQPIKTRAALARSDERKLLLAIRGFDMTKRSGFHTNSRPRTGCKLKTSSTDSYRPLYPSRTSFEPAKQEIEPIRPRYQRNWVSCGVKGATKLDVIQLKNLISMKTKSEPYLFCRSSRPVTLPCASLNKKENLNFPEAPQKEEERPLSALIKKTGLDRQMFSLPEPVKATSYSLPICDFSMHYRGVNLMKSDDLEEELIDTVPVADKLDELETDDCLDVDENSCRDFIRRVEHLSWLISKDQIDKIDPQGDSWESEIVREKILESEFHILNDLGASHHFEEAPYNEPPERPRPETEDTLCEDREPPCASSDRSNSTSISKECEEENLTVKTMFFDLSEAFGLTKFSSAKIQSLRLPKKMYAEREKTWFTDEDD